MHNADQWMLDLESEETVVLFYCICFYYFHVCKRLNFHGKYTLLSNISKMPYWKRRNSGIFFRVLYTLLIFNIVSNQSKSVFQVIKSVFRVSANINLSATFASK